MQNRGAYLKIASIIAALACCDGLANFGWSPYFGGYQDSTTYFGCIMLTFSVLAWLVCRGVSENGAPRAEEPEAK